MATTIRVGHAFGPEISGVSGRPGDQKDGKEVRIDAAYKIVGGGFHTLLRPKSTELAEKSARACEAACKNDNIGYSQQATYGAGRTSLYTEAVKVNFDIAKIVTPCNVDCSALMAVCAIAGGSEVNPNVSTHTMASSSSSWKTFANNGDYEVKKDNIYFSDTALLRRGDILIRTGHTLMVLANGDGTPVPDYNDDIASGYVTDTLVPDLITARVAVDLLNVSTTYVRISAVLEKLKNGEAQSSSFDQCDWSYKLEQLDLGGNTCTKNIGTHAGMTNFTITNLAENSTYAVTVFTTASGGFSSISSSRIVFTTAQKAVSDDTTNIFPKAKSANMINKYFLKVNNGYDNILIYDNIRK